MLQLSIQEFGRIPRAQLSHSQQRGLQRFDEQQAARSGDSIFDWSRRDWIVAKSYVGVIQSPGLQIEILPKIDHVEVEDSHVQQSRQNLLFMLSVARLLPFHERDLAGQQIQQTPVLEALIRVFVQRLLQELRRGQQHLYVHREENLPFVKGRILMSEHLVRNAAQKQLTFVAFDEFQNDTLLNRILKAACHKLLAVTRISGTQQYLRESLLELADVELCEIQPFHFDQIHLDRNSERFRDLLTFCRLLFLNSTPTPSSGATECFSLLFPMEKLFEEFVGRLIHRHAESFGFLREDIHLQARSRRRWLLRSESGTGAFRLKPDVLINAESGEPALILDTKWKRLLSDDVHSRNGVSQSDIYQLFAYSQRYRCQENVLLYPRVPGATAKCFTLDGDHSGTRIRIEFLDLDYNLRANREQLVRDLKRAITGRAPN